MKTINLLVIVVILLGFSACKTNKYAVMTQISPDHQITGKGQGKKDVDVKRLSVTAEENTAFVQTINQINDNGIEMNIVDNGNYSSISISTKKGLSKIFGKTYTNNISNIKVSTKQEKRAVNKQLRSWLGNKENRQQLRSDDQLLKIIVAIFIPPLAVLIHQDGITKDFWIDLLLTLLFFLPGVIFAIYVILKK